MPHVVQAVHRPGGFRGAAARGLTAVVLLALIGATALPAGATTADGGAAESSTTTGTPTPAAPAPAPAPSDGPVDPGVAEEETAAPAPDGTPAPATAPSPTEEPAPGAGPAPVTEPTPTADPARVTEAARVGAPEPGAGLSAEAVEAPAAVGSPTDLQVTDLRPDRATIGWTAPTQGAAPTGYRVELRDGAIAPAQWSVAALVGPDARATTLTGLTTSRMYLVRVVALAGALESAPSDEAWVDVPVTRLAVVAVEEMVLDGRSLRFSGWAVDPDTSQPYALRWTLDGTEVARLASDGLREDVAAAYPGTGAAHGFAVTAELGSGPHEVCVVATNPGELSFGQYWTRDCREVRVEGTGTGALETVTSAGLAVTLGGWALDPHDGTALVRYTIDGRTPAQPVPTELERPDVAALHPGTGSRHGFSSTFTTTAGQHEVCAWVRVGWWDAPQPAEAPLGCRQVTVVAPPKRMPLMNVESLTATPFGVTITGWALDPDVVGPISVRVTGHHESTQSVYADLPRPDVARVHPGTGDRHGFRVTYPLRPGTYRLCVTATDDVGGDVTAEQCRTATVVNVPARGNLESVTLSGDQVTVTGWAVDPNVAGPTNLSHGVDRRWEHGSTTDVPRPDVAQLYPGLGGVHGFRYTYPVRPTTHTVCVYASEWAQDGGMDSVELGCRPIPGRTPPPDLPIIGNLESLTVAGDKVTFTGWALKPYHDGGVSLDVVIDRGFGGWVDTGLPRPDVALAYPGTGQLQGFSKTITVAPGTHELCVQVGGDADTSPRLGCRTFTVAPTRLPVGNFESLTAAGSTVTLTGWTLDLDDPRALSVHVYVDGGWFTALTAQGSRPDVGRAYPGSGDQHGFTKVFTAARGTHEVCAYAIDASGSGSSALGCKTVTVP